MTTVITLDSLEELAKAGLLDKRPDLARRLHQLRAEREMERDLAEAQAELAALKNRPQIVRHTATTTPSAHDDVCIVAAWSGCWGADGSFLGRTESAAEWHIGPGSVTFVPAEVWAEIGARFVQRHRSEIAQRLLLVTTQHPKPDATKWLANVRESQTVPPLAPIHFGQSREHVLQNVASAITAARWIAHLKADGAVFEAEDLSRYYESRRLGALPTVDTSVSLFDDAMRFARASAEEQQALADRLAREAAQRRAGMEHQRREHETWKAAQAKARADFNKAMKAPTSKKKTTPQTADSGPEAA